MRIGAGEPDQRKMPERWHGAPLDDPDATVTLGPLGEPLPAEFRPPAEPPCDRREALLEQTARTGLGAQMIDQDDFAAWLW